MWYQAIIEMILAICALAMTVCLIQLTLVVKEDVKRLRRTEKYIQQQTQKRERK